MSALYRIALVLAPLMSLAYGSARAEPAAVDTDAIDRALAKLVRCETLDAARSANGKGQRAFLSGSAAVASLSIVHPAPSSNEGVAVATYKFVVAPLLRRKRLSACSTSETPALEGSFEIANALTAALGEASRGEAPRFDTFGFTIKLRLEPPRAGGSPWRLERRSGPALDAGSNEEFDHRVELALAIAKKAGATSRSDNDASLARSLTRALHR